MRNGRTGRLLQSARREPHIQTKAFCCCREVPVFQGKILGGCLEVLYDIFDNSRYADSVSMCEKYELFPPKEDWAGKILLLETCEEQPVPQLYRKMVQTLKKTGIFEVISGIICGKPMDELYFEEYKKNTRRRSG